MKRQKGNAHAPSSWLLPNLYLVPVPVFKACPCLILTISSQKTFPKMGVGTVLKPERQEAGGFIQAATAGFQAKCLSRGSSWLQLTFLRQEINKWAEPEKQIMLPPALGEPSATVTATDASQRREEKTGTQRALMQSQVCMWGESRKIGTAHPHPSFIVLAECVSILNSAFQVKLATRHLCRPYEPDLSLESRPSRKTLICDWDQNRTNFISCPTSSCEEH